MITTPRTTTSYRLKVNTYDHVSSLVVAMLYLASVVVVALAVIFLFRTFAPVKMEPTVTPVPTPVAADKPNGATDALAVPGLQDMPEVEQPKLQETLKQLTDAVTNKTAIVADTAVRGDGPATTGDSQAGPIGESDSIGGPPSSVKELVFPHATEAAYAAMLDQMGAELAVLDLQNNTIACASNLSAEVPTSRTQPYHPDSRFYFVARGTPLRPIELRLARKAGIMQSGALVVTLYPQEVAELILRLEREQMQKAGKQLSDIERTVYRVEKHGSKFTLVVAEQLYY